MTTDTQKSIHWTELDVLRGLLVLEFIRRTKFPLTYCVVGFVLISLMRYLLGPFIQAFGYERLGWGVLNWILGNKDTAGVSYPLSPWMAYPFAGYIIGVAAMHYRDFSH